MKWFLLIYVYACHGGGIDPGIVPGNCVNSEQRIAMPSIEVCRQVREVNQGSKCLTEDIESPPRITGK